MYDGSIMIYELVKVITNIIPTSDPNTQTCHNKHINMNIEKTGGKNFDPLGQAEIVK